jgi:Fe-S-cluster-containing hydrogenase component 2
VCPDNAIHKIEGAHGYAIDYDFCKGCGLCVAECPAGAIEMRAEREAGEPITRDGPPAAQVSAGSARTDR